MHPYVCLCEHTSNDAYMKIDISYYYMYLLLAAKEDKGNTDTYMLFSDNTTSYYEVHVGSEAVKAQLKEWKIKNICLYKNFKIDT